MDKTFAGAKLRHLRETRSMSQADLARLLEISPSYLNQIEHNARPLTVPVLFRITQAFGVDAEFFANNDTARLVADVREALLDESLGVQATTGEINELATNLPSIAQALVRLHRRYRDAVENTAALVTEDGSGVHGSAAGPLPHEEVRDFFYERENYVAELDERAERMAADLPLRRGEVLSALRDRLTERYGVHVTSDGIDETVGEQHRYEPHARVLRMAPSLRVGQQAFRMASQIALLEYDDLIAELADSWAFSGPAARSLARVGLANYFAGALILPYEAFHQRAEEFRYDIERLCDHFGVGFETACHRLSTLQRPKMRGVPFSFVRVDRAGNMSKRQSAAGFHFSRVGGACPLWNIYEAFTSPGKILTQIASLPDGKSYFWIARTISRNIGGYGSPGKMFTVGLGCELRHARRLVYSTGLDLDDRAAATPIGMGCKVCERPACPQRAFPTIGKQLTVDENTSTFVPYPAVPKP
ncbi:short-chain fatty acyl-CoA regulator family protein [Amycolatopsis magusensis]|uniref:Transcriptional regulator/transcriptional regulator with XRE-family HTH domain n=1 Tax=Amycolatopsis magusensis TaxID=882444 RepID=A0ABS4Q6S2_9PSEU|nr:short-chain fatty acyl-CoA regulator family protein [Amycolatopsis magusensis]MBP2186789.1 putative transcriptional regulator/transcriptional regulator with XRE-family HTH domain [Amycolatopsis magusensis]MDI5980429.1 short-chain fatty acyl-CoA regulator family protein [Amycolatopsis magusensis]